jgi:hypothetical protein
MTQAVTLQIYIRKVICSNLGQNIDGPDLDFPLIFRHTNAGTVPLNMPRLFSHSLQVVTHSCNSTQHVSVVDTMSQITYYRLYMGIGKCKMTYVDFLSTCTTSPSLGLIEPSVGWIPRALVLRVNRPKREGNHSPSSGAKAHNAWNYFSTPLYRLMAWCLRACG